jgi:putative transcriptional regulator
LTSPRHHPPETLLLEYAAGALREPQALAVATHLAYCPVCRRQTEHLDELGGALLDTLPPESLPSDALSALIARLDEVPAAPKPSSKSPTRAASRNPLGGLLVPEPLRGYLARIPEPVSWVSLAGGVSALHLGLGKVPVVAEVLKMTAGSALPVHRHSDQELILTLQGSFSEEAGPYSAKGGFYTVGDLGEFEGGSTHTVVAGADGCVCYRVLAGPVERLSTPI